MYSLDDVNVQCVQCGGCQCTVCTVIDNFNVQCVKYVGFNVQCIHTVRRVPVYSVFSKKVVDLQCVQYLGC